MTTRARHNSAPEYTENLWREYVERRDPRTRACLLDQYLGLVHHAAREVAARTPKLLELEDLVGAGTVGLVQALESFDPSRGFAFSSYAMPRIRGAIRDEIRSWDWVPRSVRERNRRVRRTAEGLHRRLGREPEAREMAEALGVDLETYWRYLDDTRDPVLLPLDAGSDAGEESGGGLAEVVADPAGREREEARREAESLRELARAFETLSEKDRLILTLSYYERLTLRQIGEVLHISESRVSQLRTRALRRLTERVEPEEKAA